MESAHPKCRCLISVGGRKSVVNACWWSCAATLLELDHTLLGEPVFRFPDVFACSAITRLGVGGLRICLEQGLWGNGVPWGSIETVCPFQLLSTVLKEKCREIYSNAIKVPLKCFERLVWETELCVTISY